MAKARSLDSGRRGPLSRRAFTATFGAMLLSPGLVHARPGKKIQVVVPYPAGGPLDSVARIVTQKLSEQTSDVFIVENKAGANGDIGARAVASGPTNGDQWLFTSDALITVNPAFYAGRADLDIGSKLKVVSVVGAQPSLLVVNRDFKAKTLQEFIDLAKTTELNYASGGVGSAGHLTMEYFGSVAGLKLRHIPYRGAAPAMIDLIGGQVPAAFLAIGGAIEAVKHNQLRPLAVSSQERIPSLPSVPTVRESGFPDFVVQTAYFVMLPSKTPDAVSGGVADDLRKALADGSVQERLRGLGIGPMAMTPAEASQWLAGEREKWTRLIKSRGIVVP